jgi:pyruvate/2-oxoglutarate/acetoin dehydrogenase E1 component
VSGVREIRYREALNEALREELIRDESVFLIGEDIADPYGGNFKVTAGLSTEFGDERIRNAPDSEGVICGLAVGAAMCGWRPVAEVMYVDFSTLGMDYIVNHAAKLRYMSGGQISVPVVFRMQGGAGRASGAQHTQSLEAWFAHIPGLYVAMPATTSDAKGLLKTAIRDDNPVVFIEHKLLYAERGPVPEEDYTVPFGVAERRRAGGDVTVVAWSRMVGFALEAAEELAAEGIEAEVIDLRTIVPLDIDTVVESVSKTHRLLIVQEAVTRGGFAGEIAMQVIERAHGELEAPIARVGARNTPVPFSRKLEDYVTPNVGNIRDAIRACVTAEAAGARR